MAFKYGNRPQLTFLPDSLEDYVTAEDPVRLYDAFVDSLDLSSLGFGLNRHQVGNSSYDPVAMLKVLVYSYSYGWRSSRKIERALHHNMSFIWLAGGLKPDHKTIAEFRRTHKEAIVKILKQTARICLKLGFIEGNLLFVDGTKLRANAGRDQTKSLERAKQEVQMLDKRIKEVLNECERIDSQEKGSLVKLNQELANKKKAKAKIQEALSAIEEEEKALKKPKNINLTDPESKILKGRNGSHSGYNVQMSVDQKHGLIVNLAPTNNPNDLNELSSQHQQGCEVLGKKVPTVCADAGYSSQADLKKLIDNEVEVIVPNKEQTNLNKDKKPFGKSEFHYDQENDSYQCPANKKLVNRGGNKERARFEYRTEAPSICRNCQYFGECTSSKAGRRLYRQQTEVYAEIVADHFQTPEAQQIYKQRKTKVELPFGHIKRNLGIQSFLLRGKTGVAAELSLMGTALNLTRLINLAGGIKQAIRLLKAI